MNEQFIKLLREAFYAELAVKTGWGKEELKLAFERSVSNAVARVLDEAKQQ